MKPIVAYVVSLGSIIALEILIYILAPAKWNVLFGTYGTGAVALVFLLDLYLAIRMSHRVLRLMTL